VTINRFKPGEKVRMWTAEMIMAHPDFSCERPDGSISMRTLTGITEGMRWYCGKEFIVEKSDTRRIWLEGQTPYMFSEVFFDTVDNSFDKEITKIRLEIWKEENSVSETTYAS
jgi:hypothetical protein